MKEIIRTEGLSKTYGTGEAAVTALRPCDLSFGQGERVAVVGASGSGKSTLLHLLGGLDRPTKGKVLFEGKDIHGGSDDALSVFRRRNIGFVFQNYNLVPELTAEQNIHLPLMLDGKKAEDGYLRDVLERLELTDRLAHYPGELSGGQQQRVAIARAISHKPALLLCDEPTGNLDSKNGAQVVELLCNLSKEFGLTLIVVTHDAGVAEKMERSITITDGQVKAGGTV